MPDILSRRARAVVRDNRRYRKNPVRVPEFSPGLGDSPTLGKQSTNIPNPNGVE